MQTGSFLLLPIVLILGACTAQTPASRVTATDVAARQTPAPDYPLRLACAGIGGQVLLRVRIDPRGYPQQTVLLRSSGQALLDQSAMQGLQQWRFKPATRNGQAIAQTIQVPVYFRPPQQPPQRCHTPTDIGQPAIR